MVHSSSMRKQNIDGLKDRPHLEDEMLHGTALYLQPVRVVVHAAIREVRSMTVIVRLVVK